jgi:hypothetical protein
MTGEVTFRIYAGGRHVDIKTVAEGLSIEDLLEMEEGWTLEKSVYLREPDSLIPSEIRSFLTAMRDIEIVESEKVDATIKVSSSDTSSLAVIDDELVLKLPESLVKNPKDRRRTLAGNLGLLYSLSLYLFEKKYGIVSYHSSALVDEKNRLVFINGGEASSGKSVVMLEYMSHYGRDSDYRVLSTEMGHFSIVDNEFIAYSGSVYDNVSLFPDEPEKIKLMNHLFPDAKLPDPDMDTEVRGTDGSVKTAVSVKDYYARQMSYSSKEGYKLVYLMPTIKMGKMTKNPVVMGEEEWSGLFSSLVGVARQKLGQKQPSWIYNEEASLLLPAWFLSGEQEIEARTIENSLKDEFLKAVVKIEGTPVDFNRNPGEYWSKIRDVLDGV